MKAVNCLDCGNTLFKIVPLDEKGNFAMDANSPLDLESDCEDEYFVCPHCKARNVVISTTSDSGLPALKLSHIK